MSPVSESGEAEWDTVRDDDGYTEWISKDIPSYADMLAYFVVSETSASFRSLVLDDYYSLTYDLSYVIYAKTNKIKKQIRKERLNYPCVTANWCLVAGHLLTRPSITPGDLGFHCADAFRELKIVNEAIREYSAYCFLPVRTIWRCESWKIEK